MRTAASVMSLGTTHTAVFGTSERAEQAARLLREALALLADESAELPAGRRSSDRLLRLPEVKQLTGLGRSAIYQQMQFGTFPHSVKVGSRVAAWSEAAVQAWISHRLEGGPC